MGMEDPFGGAAPAVGMGAMDPNALGAGGAGGQRAAGGALKEIGFLTVTCKALNLKRYSPSANREFVEALQTNFQSATNLFLPAGTTLTNQIVEVELTNHTFNFNVTLQLKDVFRF